MPSRGAALSPFVTVMSLVHSVLFLLLGRLGAGQVCDRDQVLGLSVDFGGGSTFYIAPDDPCTFAEIESLSACGPYLNGPRLTDPNGYTYKAPSYAMTVGQSVTYPFDGLPTGGALSEGLYAVENLAFIATPPLTDEFYITHGLSIIPTESTSTIVTSSTIFATATVSVTSTDTITIIPPCADVTVSTTTTQINLCLPTNTVTITEQPITKTIYEYETSTTIISCLPCQLAQQVALGKRQVDYCIPQAQPSATYYTGTTFDTTTVFGTLTNTVTNTSVTIVSITLATGMTTVTTDTLTGTFERTLTVTEFAPPPLQSVTSVITVMLSQLRPYVTLCSSGESSPSPPPDPSLLPPSAAPAPVSQPPTPPLASLPDDANSLPPSPPIGFLPSVDEDISRPPLPPPSDPTSPLENAYEPPPPPPNGTPPPPPWDGDDPPPPPPGNDDGPPPPPPGNNGEPPPPPPGNYDGPPKPPSTADVYQGGWTTSYPMPTGKGEGVPEIMPSGQSATSSPSKAADLGSGGEQVRVGVGSLFWVPLIVGFLFN